MSEITEQKNYYAIIPSIVRYDKKLNPLARLLYAEITALTNDKGFCWASNKYFSELYQVKKETISRLISALEKNNHITTEIIYKENTKEILQRRIYIDEKVKSYCEKNQKGIDKKINSPIDEKVKDNIKDYNNKVNNKDYINKCAKNKNFIIPELHEIEQYLKAIDEHNFDIEAIAINFYDYYSSNGWHVGRRKMVDWKAAVRNWIRRQKEFQKNFKKTQEKETQRDPDKSKNDFKKFLGVD